MHHYYTLFIFNFAKLTAIVSWVVQKKKKKNKNAKWKRNKCWSVLLVWALRWRLNWQQIKNSQSFSTIEIFFIYFSFFAISLCQFMTKSKILTCRTLLNVDSLHIFPFQFLLVSSFVFLVRSIIIIFARSIYFCLKRIFGGGTNQSD